MIYITSDLHFNHQKPFIYEPRGFSSPDEMNEKLIENYNNIVGPQDDVYILGDLCLGGADRLDDNFILISRLNGCKHIIRGNHDSDKKIDMYNSIFTVVEIQNAQYLKYNGYHFYLSHFPTFCSNYDDKGLKHCLINLCGHSHIRDKFIDMDKGLIYHCEVDCQNNAPVSIDQVIEDIKMYRRTHCAEADN